MEVLQVYLKPLKVLHAMCIDVQVLQTYLKPLKVLNAMCIDVQVLQAYLKPHVDRSKKAFTFGRPDPELLRRFCQWVASTICA